MNVWRLQTKTGGGKIAKYCLENNVAAIGWSLKETDQQIRESIQDFETYEKYASSAYKNINNVKRLVYRVQKDDIIWIRDAGKYYFARVKEEPSKCWRFDSSEEAKQLDVSNQLVNMEWYPVSENADESSVPGAITTAFIPSATLQKIDNEMVQKYSKMLYNKIAKDDKDGFQYEQPDISLKERDFYALLQPEDVEDLLCLWLYKEKGYVCIPSSNKKSTERYECVLINPQSDSLEHIYIQVKKGTEKLDADKFADLNGEVYLLSTEGQVYNCDKYDNIIKVDPKEIFEFATDDSNLSYIPESIQKWIAFLAQVDNEKVDISKKKGIMFDTNLSYSEKNESEMLSANQICAYGDAKRFVERFNKGDYALYYSKGKGVIAIGEICSSEANEIPSVDGKYQDVKLIVPETHNGMELDMDKSITPREMKELLGHGFYLASTIKVPYLDVKEVDILVDALKKKYQE